MPRHPVRREMLEQALLGPGRNMSPWPVYADDPVGRVERRRDRGGDKGQMIRGNAGAGAVLSSGLSRRCDHRFGWPLVFGFGRAFGADSDRRRDTPKHGQDAHHDSETAEYQFDVFHECRAPLTAYLRHGAYSGQRGRHSGIFPCFLGGRVSRLVNSPRRARPTAARVRDGSITSVIRFLAAER